MYPNVGKLEFMTRNFGAEAVDYDGEFKAAHWPPPFQHLLGLTAVHCRPTRQRLHSHAFFLLNPEDPFDVVDYWNLRAAGIFLMPLTMQDYTEFQNFIREFGATAAYPINETITNHVVLMKAPSITDEEQEAVANWFRDRTNSCHRI